MDGILIIDKPAGITSHDVVARIRRILKTKRVGHTGTLDPFATGVVVILVGQATRLAQFLDKDEKEYVASVRFGFETETGDVTGKPRPASVLCDQEIAELLDRTDWKRVFSDLRGEIIQMPPMYSAKKVDGKKLYELARRGEVIERRPISVSIRRLEILDRSETLEARTTIRIRVACSAGTYIRVLAEDIGSRLGIGAHLSELRRTTAGKFTIDMSLTLEELEQIDQPANSLIPMTEAVGHLAKFTLSDDRIGRTRNGLATRVVGSAFAEGEPVQMLDRSGGLVAIGIYQTGENIIQPKVVLV